MCQPHRCISDSECALATPPGADDDGVVGLHGDHAVELQDAVSVGVAVRGRVDVLGVRTGVSGKLLLPVDHAVVGQELPCHGPILARRLASKPRSHYSPVFGSQPTKARIFRYYHSFRFSHEIP